MHFQTQLLRLQKVIKMQTASCSRDRHWEPPTGLARGEKNDPTGSLSNSCGIQITNSSQGSMNMSLKYSSLLPIQIC